LAANAASAEVRGAKNLTSDDTDLTDFHGLENRGTNHAKKPIELELLHHEQSAIGN
jgi:hypothetical protein